MSTNRPDLCHAALRDMNRLGYSFAGLTDVDREHCHGASVFRFDQDGKSILVLLQTRSTRNVTGNPDRYWVGIMWRDMLVCDQTIIWFEGRNCMLVLPNDEIKGIWEAERDLGGSIRLLGKQEQWSVNIDIEKGTFTPAGGDDHYPVKNYLRVLANA